ncbi:MAG: ATP-binding protein [bacterium]|nr:ATP-binding protein [bacterium]
MPLFTFNTAGLPQLFVAFFLLLQGTIVLLQDPRALLNRSFFFFQVAIFIELAAFAGGLMSGNPSIALLFIQVGIIGVILIPVSTYLFSLYYSEREGTFQRWIAFAALGATFILLLMAQSPFLIRGVFHYSWGYYINLGPLGFALIGLFVVLILFFLYNFYTRYRYADPLQRRWHRLALLSGGFAFGGMIDFLPAYGIVLSFPPIGYLFIGSFATLMTYYILRHQLADIRIIAGRTIGYATLTAILFLIHTAFYLSFLPIFRPETSVTAQGTFFVVMLYLLNFLVEKTRIIVDQIFNKERIRFVEEIADFSTSLRNLRDTNFLLTTFFTFVGERLRMSGAAICVFEEHAMRWRIMRERSAGTIREIHRDASFGHDDIRYFIEHQEPVGTEAFSQPSIVRASHQNEVRELARITGTLLAIPLVYRETFIGFIMLGPKLSGRPIPFAEYKILARITTPFAIAWENAFFYENLQRMNKEKSDFITIASHQLRTPLTHFRWALMLLSAKETGTLTAHQQSVLTRIAASADAMLALVNQLLDVIRIEQHSSLSSSERIDLLPLVKNFLEQKMLLGEKQGVRIKLEAPEYPIWVRSDASDIRTVLEILLDNAIIYTKPLGTVILRISASQTHEQQISVEDTGIGIPRDQQADIFGKFFRAYNAVSLHPNGTGLGLFYAKALVKRQGGALWFHSEENKGSQFFFTMPAG